MLRKLKLNSLKRRLKKKYKHEYDNIIDSLVKRSLTISNNDYEIVIKYLPQAVERKVKETQKDLDALDILRRILLNENNSPYIKIENGNVCIDVTAPINEKDCDKLKEWLNYDK